MAEETTTTPQRESTTIVCGRPLANMIRAIADRRNITMAEALEQYARPGLTREYKRVLAEMQAEIEAGA